MKLTKDSLREIVKEVIAETDGHPQILKKNKEVAHNWATHMEWKSSTDKNKYDDVIGEVIHHTLFEDGTISKYDVKFGNKTIKNIPTAMLEVVTEKSHSHEVTDEDDDGDGFANYDDSGKDTSTKATKVKTSIRKIT